MCSTGGRAAVGGDEARRVDLHLALLEVPVSPHRQVFSERPIGPADVDAAGQAQHLPQRGDPRADGDDDLIRAHIPKRGVHDRCHPRIIDLEAGDLHLCPDLRPGGARLVREPEHRLPVERVAARVLVQADAQSRGAPVRIQRAHMGSDLALAHVQFRGISDPLLALVYRHQVALLGARAERDVTGAVVVQGLRIGFPDLDARRHQLGHGGLEVVVSHDSAGDPGGSSRDSRLVDHEHPLPLAGQVPGTREPVDTGADHEDGNGSGEGIGHWSSYSGMMRSRLEAIH
jgi:hypothetical protein